MGHGPRLKTPAVKRPETKTLGFELFVCIFKPQRIHHAVALWDHLVARHWNACCQGNKVLQIQEVKAESHSDCHSKTKTPFNLSGTDRHRHLNEALLNILTGKMYIIMQRSAFGYPSKLQRFTVLQRDNVRHLRNHFTIVNTDFI